MLKNTANGTEIHFSHVIICVNSSTLDLGIFDDIYVNLPKEISPKFPDSPNYTVQKRINIFFL
jgi:hypothetical protein